MLHQGQMSQRLKRTNLQVPSAIPNSTAFTPAPIVVVPPRVENPILASSDQLSDVADYDDRFPFSPPDQSAFYRAEEIPSISTAHFSMGTTCATENIVIFDQKCVAPFKRYPTRIRSPPPKFPAAPISTNPHDEKNLKTINDMHLKNISVVFFWMIFSDG